MTLLQRNLEYIKSIVGEADITYADKTGKLILQTLAIAGGGKLISATGKAITSLFKEENDSADFIVSNLNENEKNSKKLKPKKVSKSTHFNDIKKNFDKYGFNFLNRWAIDFGTNTAISTSDWSESLKMLKFLTNEVSLPSIEIETTNNPLFHSKNPDISNVIPGDFTISVWIDSDMIVYNGILSVINEMKDFDTGRYGYRKNYEFPKIRVFIANSLNDDDFGKIITFENCIISSVSDITVGNIASSVKNITLTFQYDRVKYGLNKKQTTNQDALATNQNVLV